MPHLRDKLTKQSAPHGESNLCADATSTASPLEQTGGETAVAQSTNILSDTARKISDASSQTLSSMQDVHHTSKQAISTSIRTSGLSASIQKDSDAQSTPGSSARRPLSWSVPSEYERERRASIQTAATHTSQPLPLYRSRTAPESVESGSITRPLRISVTVVDDIVIKEAKVTLKQRIRTLLPVIVMFIVYGIILLLFLLFQDKIFPVLEEAADQIRDMGVGGIAIFAAAIALSGMPPVPGYGMLTLFCGYVWGTWLGFVPAALGAFTGAMVSFIVLRRYLTGYCERVFLENPKVALVVRSVEGKGLKLLWAIRVAPYPFNLMNSLCAASNISLRNYTLATSLALPKLLLETAIGSGVQSLSEGLTENINWQKILQLCIILFVGGGVFIYVCYLSRRAIRRYKEELKRQHPEEQDDNDQSAQSTSVHSETRIDIHNHHSDSISPDTKQPPMSNVKDVTNTQTTS